MMCSARGRVNQIRSYNQSWMALFPKTSEVCAVPAVLYGRICGGGVNITPLLRFQKDTVQKVRFKYDHQ